MTIKNDPANYITRELISRGGRRANTREPRKLNSAQQAAVAAELRNAIVDPQGFIDFSKIFKVVE